MSQELRDYNLMRLDDNPAEARNMSLTATVGPNSDSGNPRGMQITLETPNGYAYARVSEDQLRDMMHVIRARLTEGGGFTATGIEADRLMVGPSGNVERSYL